MITKRLAGAIAAGALAIGIVAGSTVTIVGREVPTAGSVDWTAHMSQMGSMMSGQAGMMSGDGMMSGGGMMSVPGASAMPNWMWQHHAGSPAPTR